MKCAVVDWGCLRRKGKINRSCMRWVTSAQKGHWESTRSCFIQRRRIQEGTFTLFFLRKNLVQPLKCANQRLNNTGQLQLSDLCKSQICWIFFFFLGGIFNLLWKRCCPYALVRFRIISYFDLEYLLNYPVVSHLKMLKRTPELHSTGLAALSPGFILTWSPPVSTSILKVLLLVQIWAYQWFAGPLTTSILSWWLGLTAYGLMVMDWVQRLA